MILFTYDENGNLKTRSDSAGNSSTFTYDELNRRKTETVAGSAKSYGYDDIGNLTLTDAWGTTGYGFYADNRLKTITAPGSSAISYAYDDTHYPRTQTITYPGTTGTLKSSFDLSGKPTAIDAKTTGTTERKLAYSYLPNTVAAGSPPGELVDTENEYDNGSASVAASWKYKYDGLLRLCAASTTGTLPASCASTATTGTAGWDQYVYDNASNRIARLIGTTKTSYGYDLANELCWAYTGSSTNACASPPAGATSYTHDSDGERTAPGSLSYDAFQRLSNIGGSNALSSLSPSNNELVGDGTTTLTNSRIGLDSSTVGGARTDYIRDPAGTLIGEHTSAGTRYITPDTRGSTRWIWNASTLDKTYTYDPDGNTTGTGSGADSKIRYAGGYLAGASTSTPLYHYGARYYDPATARWAQRDPLDQYDDLRQANPYAYVSDDPIGSIDPLGRATDKQNAACGLVFEIASLANDPEDAKPGKPVTSPGPPTPCDLVAPTAKTNAKCASWPRT